MKRSSGTCLIDIGPTCRTKSAIDIFILLEKVKFSWRAVIALWLGHGESCSLDQILLRGFARSVPTTETVNGNDEPGRLPYRPLSR